MIAKPYANQLMLMHGHAPETGARQGRKYFEHAYKRRFDVMKVSAITLLAGTLLMTTPAVYSEEHGSMSDAQHRKTMSGMHHPDQAEDATKSDCEAKGKPTMSDAQHRKLMGGSMQHPDQDSDAAKSEAVEKNGATMSDTQHRKSMGGGMHHPDKE